MANNRRKSHATDVSLLLMRVFIGGAIAYHGAGKVFGNMEGFGQAVAGLGFPFPAVFAWVAALSEFAGGILIALGLLTRVSALFAMSVMAVAFFMVHAGDPFRVKELAYAYLIFTAGVLISGGGYFSADNFIRSRSRSARKRNRANAGSAQAGWAHPDESIIDRDRKSA